MRTVEQDWRTRLLSLITNPNVAYLLMLIGIYGLLLEGYNPGSVLPGVVGYQPAARAVCIRGPVRQLRRSRADCARRAAHHRRELRPSFGTLGLGGIVSFVIGSVMLLDDDVPGFGIACLLIGTMALAGSLVLLAIVSFAVHAAPAGRLGRRGTAQRARGGDRVLRYQGCRMRPRRAVERDQPDARAPGANGAHPEPRRRSRSHWSNRIRLTAGDTT